jgi:4-amino-4-deoxy-L-arabinose transferase-like glycosyltransferase
MSRKIKSPKSTDNRAGLLKNLFWVFIVLYILFSLLLFDPKLFTGGDNAVYINLAQSLVQGKGYRNIGQPGEPGHTQYPPGLPLLLSLVMLIFGKSVIAMKLFIMLCGLAAFYLFSRISLRVFKEKRYLAVAAYLLVPIFITYNHWILSEIPFLLANLATIYLILRAEEGKKSYYYPAFLCANLAFFIRTTGIALIAAVLFYLIARRKFKESLILLVSFLILFFAWQVRNAHYSQTGGYLDQFLAKYFYQPELGRIGIGDFFSRVAHNFFLYFFTILPQTLYSTIGARWLLAALGATALGLLVYGFILRRKEWSIFEFYLIFGLIFLLIWPEIWSSDRFLLPILPILLIYILLGLLQLPAQLRYLLPTLGSFFILVNLWSIFAQVRVAVADNVEYLHGDRYAGYSEDWRRYFETIEWIRANIPEDKVVMARKPEFVYLLSSRKSFIYPFSSDPDKIRESIRQADFIILDNFFWSRTTQRVLLPVIQAEPNRFEVVYRSRPPEFYVLRIKK